MNDHAPNEDSGGPYYAGSVRFEQLDFTDECPDEEDFRWASHNPELERLYGGLVVVVYQRTVWGAGKTYDAAWQDAQRKPNFPSESQVAFVPISAPRPLPPKGRPVNDQILEPDTGVSLPQNSVPFEQLHFPSDCDGEEDYHWALNDPEVRRLYSGLVVVVHQHTVWGVGKTYEAAWEDAQRKPNCPSESETAFVVI